MMRDDFPQPVKEQLAKRVGIRCSNPQCRQQTSGPQAEGTGAVNIGVAAHITAAARNGPRYDSKLTSEERRSPDNGIWLCQTCAKLVDSDTGAHPADILRDWKEIAEATALLELKGLRVVPDNRAQLTKLDDELPELVAEMRDDLRESPFAREFILLKREWSYNGDPDNPVLVYYFNDHPHLRQKIRMLENYGFVQEISFNNIDRFQISEDLAGYLRSGG